MRIKITKREIRRWLVGAAWCLVLAAGGLRAGEGAEPDQELRDVAVAIEKGINAGNAAALDAKINVDAMLDEAFKKDKFSPQNVASFKVGVKNSLKLGGQIASQTMMGGSYKLLRITPDAQHPKLLFRLLTPQGGLNYHEFTLTKRGAYQIDDLYVFATGEPLSVTLHRSGLPVLVDAEKGTLEKLLTGESDYMANLPKIQQFTQNVLAGNAVAAMQIYRQLPKSLQEDKAMMMLRLRATMRDVNGKEYNDTMLDFKRLYPGDPCLNLVLLDYYFNQKQYDKVRECLISIETRVGKDPYLDVLRSSSYNMEGNFDEALKLAELAIAAEPAMRNAHGAKVLAAVKKQDWKLASAALTALEKDCGVQMPDLRKIPLYADYVKSGEYDKWLQTKQDAAGAPAATEKAASDEEKKAGN